MAGPVLADRIGVAVPGLMHTFFRGKVVRIMPKRYDGEFKARAVRLVIDHAEEYDTRTACVAAVEEVSPLADLAASTSG